MDVERALVCRIARTGSMESAVLLGIEPYHFKDPECADVYAWMIRHLRDYSAVPSLELTRRRWSKFDWYDVPDPLESVLDEFVAMINRRELIVHIRELSEIADDPSQVRQAGQHALEKARELNQVLPTTNITRYSDSLSRLALYNQKVALGRTPGISMVLPELDDLTYGIHPGDLIIIEGFLGVGKSSLGIAMAGKAYFEDGKSSFFASLEMDGDKLAMKWDAWAAQVSYRAMKRLQLGEGDLEKWERAGERAAAAKFEKDIIVIDDQYRPTADWMYGQVERWRCDLNFADTIDEFRAPSHLKSWWEQNAWAARELKGIARATRRPIVGMAQAGREAEERGATLGNIAGSLDIARKADVVIGLHQTKDMQKIKKMEARALKIRDDEGMGNSYDYFWDVDGEMELRPWRPTDLVPERA